MRVFALFLVAALCLAAAAEVPQMTLTSPSFTNGGKIPKTYSCDGGDRSPAFAWSNVPEGSRTLLLICDDPDAPGGKWVHWLFMDIPATEKGIEENGTFARSTLGRNSWGKSVYNGPCPPPGKTHRYVFTLYALDTWLAMPRTSTKDEVEAHIQGHILGKAQLMGTYRR